MTLTIQRFEKRIAPKNVPLFKNFQTEDMITTNRESQLHNSLTADWFGFGSLTEDR